VQQRGSRKQAKKLAEIERKLSQANIHYIRMDYRPAAISLLDSPEPTPAMNPTNGPVLTK
jgi:hypothetical protein